jgi:hypothetical protein|tara:strand:- start:30 stop:305 length:276 start_codon:yes stop_codon:yes gene_type:complete
LFACVKVAVCLPCDETYKLVIPAEAFAVVGIKEITLSIPNRLSAKVDVVALAVKVIDPVEFNFPSKELLRTMAICRLCSSAMGLTIGATGN